MTEVANTLEEHLDGYSFVNFSEVVGAVEEYYVNFYGDEHTSYGDLVLYGELAEGYCLKRGILGFDETEEIREKIDELENFSYGHNECDNYMKICDLCGYSPREHNYDLVDEEWLVGEVKRRADDGDLRGVHWLLEDIDLDNDYFILDGYGRPRDIDRSDCESLIEERLEELRGELDNMIDDLKNAE